MKRLCWRDWRLWLGIYGASAALYYLSIGSLPLSLLPGWLRPWLFYASLAACVVSVSLLAAAQPLVIVAAPLAVLASLLSYLRYGLMSSLPLLALAVSSIVPFAEARIKLRRALRVSRFAKQVRALYLGDAVLMALFGADLVLGLLLIARSGEWISTLSGLVVASYGVVGLGILAYDLLRLQLTTSIEPYSTKWFVALWFRSSLLRKVLELYSDRLRNLIELAGVTEAPVVLAARVLTAAFLTLAIAPATLCLSPYLPSLALAAFLAAVGAAISIPVAPYLWLSSKVGDRKRQVEDELPWFTLYSAILQRVGIPLHEAFKRLIGKSILPAMEREAKILNKHVHLLGHEDVTALEELARKHPSREFRNLVLGYTSILRTGGDLAAYLESKLFEQLRLLTMRLKRFADTALGTGEILLVFYLIFASVLAVAGSAATDIVQAFTFVAAPTIAAAMVGYVSTVQPRTVFRYFIDTNHVIPAVATASVAAAALVGGIQGWLALSMVFLAIGLGYGAQYSYGLSRARALEKQLIDLLHDITEYRKIGLPPSQALQRIARSRSYGEPLDSVIRAIAHQLSLSIPLAEAMERVHLPSWLARFVFFVLGEIEASGGGSVRVLEMLMNFIEEYWLAQREMKAKLRVYEILIMLTPLMLGTIVSASIGMARALSIASLSKASTIPIPIWLPSPSSAGALKLLVVGSVASMALVASKAIDGSIRSLLRLAIAAILLTIYGLWLDPLAQHFVEHLLTASNASGG